MSDGTKLAVSTLKVSDIMVSRVVAFTLSHTVRDCIQILLDNKLSGAPLVYGDVRKPISIVSELDLLKFAAMNGLEKNLSHFIDKLPDTKELVTVKPQDPFSEAFKIFLTQNFRRILVVDEDGFLRGIISRRDILKAFMRQNPKN